MSWIAKRSSAEAYVPLSLRTRLDHAVNDVRRAVLNRHANPDSAAAFSTAAIELSDETARAVMTILVPWCEEGQKFVLAHPYMTQWLTPDGASTYLQWLLDPPHSRSASEATAAEHGEHAGGEEHDVACYAAIRLARIVAPVAAGLIADGGQDVREHFDAELDRLLSACFEGPVGQGAGERVGLVTQNPDHLAEGGLGIIGGDDRGQDSLKSLDGLAPALSGFGVESEREAPGPSHALGGGILRAGGSVEGLGHRLVDPQHEALPVWCDGELVSGGVEDPTERFGVNVGVGEEPVEDIKPQELAASECEDQRVVGAKPREVTCCVNPHREADEKHIVSGESALSPDPDIDGGLQESGHSGDGLESRGAAAPLRERDPGFRVHDSSSVGGDGAGSGSSASSTSDARKPTDTRAPRAERERIGATLRTIRELRGYTPDELAREMGISRPYLSNIEAGRKNLTARLLVKACEALAVPQKSLIREGYLPDSEEPIAGERPHPLQPGEGTETSGKEIS